MQHTCHPHSSPTAALVIAVAAVINLVEGGRREFMTAGKLGIFLVNWYLSTVHKGNTPDRGVEQC